jgi:hypothetical protein
MKTDHLDDSLKQNYKMKKRALYCSLNKNFVGSKIGLQPNSNKSSSNVLVEKPNNN